MSRPWKRWSLRRHSRNVDNWWYRLVHRRRIAREESVWDAAATFDDVCLLTAAWINGDMIYHPGYCGDRVESETEPFATALVAANRAGYLTNDSQAAAEGSDLYGSTGSSWASCAWVTGWIRDTALLARMRDSCAAAGLWMFTDSIGGLVTTGLVDGQEGTLDYHGGPRPGPDQIWFAHPQAQAEVAAATWVEIVDPGYLDYDGGMRLWHTLAAAVQLEDRFFTKEVDEHRL